LKILLGLLNHGDDLGLGIVAVVDEVEGSSSGKARDKKLRS